MVSSFFFPCLSFLPSFLPSFLFLTLFLPAITTSMETKLKLVRIFGRLRHDAEMISEARQVCQNLLKSYPSCAFVIALLDTLTSLSARSFFEIPEQEQILLEYVLKDPRKAVKLAALRNIRKLRSSSSYSHFYSFPSSSSSSSTVIPKEKQGDIISLLFEFVRTTPYPSLRLAALQVIRSCSPSFLQLSTSPGLLLELCQELLHFSEVDDVEEKIEGEVKGVGEGQQIDNSRQNGNAEKKHPSSSSTSSSSISQLIAEEVSRILTHAAVTPLPSSSTGEDILNQKNKFAEHVLISLCSVESLQRKRSPNSIGGWYLPFSLQTFLYSS
jgi:hypothetical protein